jgi:prepilin-type N-terminal cleavage/methylation domain-containing protein
MTRDRGEGGFSMLEVLASITVFAVAAAALATATVGTLKANTNSRDTSAATALVQDKVERLRALDGAANPADLRSGTHSDPLNPMTPLGEAGGHFNRSWVVTSHTPRQGLAEVVVTVTWSRARVSRSVRSVTYVCESSTCT